ncbi:MAG: FliA/WhiG family RNA polymerase sigma factor [Acidobacteriota bacterium]|nr:FliA/WhiG family RNA polymerase sigma factor [Acidobacteriota bacterium]
MSTLKPTPKHAAKERHDPYAQPLDEEVRNRILLEQMPQVRYIARHIHDRLPQHVPLEDLVHAGVLGLMDALNKYDESRQVQFNTYAKFRIRGAILDSLRELDWSPRDLRRKARMIEGATARLSHQLGHAPTEQDLANELGLTLDAFQHLLGELEGLDLGSLHSDNGRDQDEDLCEYLPGNPEDSPYYLTMKSEMKQLLTNAISELNEKEQQVLSLYYYEELTMKEAGAVLGVGESRVSQIHSLALVRLRERLQTLLSSKQMPAHLAVDEVRKSLEGAWKKF